jgi:WhiB family transcriptional regulator, redox-sensing transcriptional regulator
VPSFSRPRLTLLTESAVTDYSADVYATDPSAAAHPADAFTADTFQPEPYPAQPWHAAAGEAGDADESWRLDALCAETDPEAFFPEKGGSTREAKRVCGGCAVREECLEYALGNDERFGIWGGLSERERRRIRLQRRVPLSA